MSEKSFKIIGRVTTKEDNEAIPGLKIMAWDKDEGNMDEYIGDTKTDELGEFKIEFTEEDFSHWGKEEKPDIYFIVENQNGIVIGTTEDAVRWDAENDEVFYIRIPKDMLNKKGSDSPADRAEQIRKILEG